MDSLFVSLLVVLAGGAAALLLSRHFILMKCITIAAVIAGCIRGLHFSVTHLLEGAPTAIKSWTWLHLFTLSFAADSVSLFFLLPVFIIPPLVLVYSAQYLDNADSSLRTALNYFFLAVVVAAMALVVTAANMITFALAWEFMSIASFFLLVFDYQSKGNRQAGYLYLIFVQGGAMLLFAAFAGIYAYTGSFTFSTLTNMPDSQKLLVFFLALLGFGSKAGIFPLHIWMPGSYSAAPGHIPALLSGVMAKMGIYGILRIYLLLDVPSPIIGRVVLICGMLTGIVGVVYALARQNMKQLLAYSSVENIGIILIGLGIGMVGATEGSQAMAFFGFAGALLHVLNHSLFKALLFMGAGAVFHRTKTDSIEELGGLIKKMPWTGSTFLIGSAAISGLPPFAGFISEFLIYYGAFQGVRLSRFPFILSICAVISLAVIGGLAAAAFTKATGLTFLGEPRTDKAVRTREAGGSMILVMVLLAAACLMIGVLPQSFVQIAFAGLRDIPFTAGYDSMPFILTVLQLSQAVMIFIALVLSISLLREGLYFRKKIVKAATWGCGFTQSAGRIQYTGASFADEMVNFFTPLIPIRKIYSGISTIFPGKITWQMKAEDVAGMHYERRLARPLFLLVYKLRWIQHGNIQLYIAYIVAAIIVLFVFFL